MGCSDGDMHHDLQCELGWDTETNALMDGGS